MNKTHLLNKTVLSLSSIAATASLAAQPASDTPPNLLIIMADQWRGQALGFLGEEAVKTPNLDKMASEGVVFNQAISCYPVSSPARAMLMTGMYPLSNKVTLNCNVRSAPLGVELQEKAVCWSDVLKTKGYDLGYIGKWHLDVPHEPYVPVNSDWNEWCPPEKRHGFDYWLAYGTYDQHLRPMYWDTDAMRQEYFFVDEWGPEYEAGKAVDYIENKEGKRATDKPFALVVSMNPPHTPYNQVPERYKEIYKDVDVETLCRKPNISPAGTEWGDHYRKNIKNYYACITGVDEQIGRIIDCLKKNGLFGNTIIVFTSDHGDCIGIHGQETKNNYYEESMRVPMIMTWPKHLKPRFDDKLLISFSDLYPTLLTMMGYEKDIPGEVETKNVGKAVMTGKGNVAYQPYFKYDYSGLDNGFRGIRTDRYTFVLKYDEGKVVETILFDRLADPYQLTNIAGKNVSLENQMRKYLKQALIEAKDKLATTL